MTGLSITRRETFAFATAGVATIAAGPVSAASGQTTSRRLTNASPILPEVTTPKSAIVSTSAGPVRGYRFGRIFTFKGVPYGADTSGANRFLPARAPEPWTAPLLTLAYGAACPQSTLNPNKNGLMRFIVQSANRFQSEDCLNVNVWSPAVGKDSKLPVVVWLHGGGYQSGSNSELPEYDGTHLANRGVVVVGVNHRIGVLGFLDLSGFDAKFASSGNVGMLDIVAALKWVQRNIANFGGDPSRVTIFGQSGGGGKVTTLMAMPAARGLFHRAMVMSGSFLHFAKPETMHEVAGDVLTASGISPANIPALQQMDVDRLILAGQKGVATFQGNKRGLVWQPVLNEDLPTDWSREAPAISADIPLIVGNTRDEIHSFEAPLDKAAMVARMRKQFGAQADTIIRSLRATFPDASPNALFVAASVMPWRQSAVEQATLQQARDKAQVWSYWYTHPSPLLDGDIGCPHGADVAPVFDNVDRQPALTSFAPEAYEIADLFSSAFVSFAATGNPQQPRLPWTPFSPTTVPTMVWDGKPHVVADPAGEARRAIAAIQPNGPF